MKHAWRGVQLKPNDPNGPAEYDRICDNCGTSQTDENEDNECEATEEAEPKG
jgi:hypothetical protein